MIKQKFLIAIVSLLFFSSLAFPQQPGISKSLSPVEKRIKELEKRIISLEERINLLEIKFSDLINAQKATSTSSNSYSQPLPNQPSNQDIEKAIIILLKVKVPATWSGSLMGGRNANVHSIEILEIGIYNDRLRYWPVKARVSGTCEARYIGEYKITSFDQVGDFKISLNDYGNWVADIRQL